MWHQLRISAHGHEDHSDVARLTARRLKEAALAVSFALGFDEA